MLGQRASGLLEAFADAKVALLDVLVFLLVGAVFVPSVHNDFVNYDDGIYVTANPHVKRGMTWDGIRWAATSTDASNWHPLTWLSHMMDCQLFGLKSWGHHLTNVLLHAANSVLLFLILQRMTGALWRSLFVALVFGLHPLRVQSVAWISERKDVLSALFWMLTICAYARYVGNTGQAAEDGSQELASKCKVAGAAGAGRGRYWPYYILALGFFSLGLMSKSMVVTLPFVLLLLDYWPLKRFQVATAATDSWMAQEHLFQSRRLRALLVEKIPFFGLSATAIVVTVFVQSTAGSIAAMTHFSLRSRIENALIAYCRYIVKFFYPVNLAAFYPHPSTWPIGQVLFAALFLLATSLVVIALRRTRPYLVMGWFWYVGTLLPVIGLVQVGSQAIADRYTYIPLIGVSVLLAWSISDLSTSWRYRRILLSLAAVAALLPYTSMSRQEIAYWADSETLFRHALAVTKDNALAHINLGVALGEKGNPEAIKEYEAALKLVPGDPVAELNLGAALLGTGRPGDALGHLRTALQQEPNQANGHFLLARALQGIGQIEEAASEYTEAIRLDPTLSAARMNLGFLLVSQKRLEEAISQFRDMVKLDSSDVKAHDFLGRALAESGRLDEAAAQLQAALSLQPEYPEARNDLGLILRRKGQLEEAIEQFRIAIRLKSGYVGAHINLGVSLHENGNVDGAIVELREALKLQPDNELAQKDLEAALRQKAVSVGP
jgi:Flp pilus assembly protein TadD